MPLSDTAKCWASHVRATSAIGDAGKREPPNLATAHKFRGIPTSDDMVDRRFIPARLNDLWISGKTEGSTKELTVFCHSANTFPRESTSPASPHQTLTSLRMS